MLPWNYSRSLSGALKFLPSPPESSPRWLPGINSFPFMSATFHRSAGGNIPPISPFPLLPFHCCSVCHLFLFLYNPFISYFIASLWLSGCLHVSSFFFCLSHTAFCFLSSKRGTPHLLSGPVQTCCQHPSWDIQSQGDSSENRCEQLQDTSRTQSDLRVLYCDVNYMFGLC